MGRKLNETVYYPPKGIYPRRPNLLLVAMNHPYAGNMGGVGRMNYRCFKQATNVGLNGGHFRAFISDYKQNLRNLVKPRFRNLAVVNLKGEQLFDSWQSIFDTNKYAAFNPDVPLLSFDGRDVRKDYYWPIKKFWHGSHTNGRLRSTGRQCEHWKNPSAMLKAASASLRTFTPALNEEITACDQKLAVLCIQVTDKYSRVIRERNPVRSRS